MQHIDPATLHFLRHRRSHPPKLLSNPPPARTEVMKLLELAAQGVIGPGAQQRVMDVARKYACPVQ